MVSLKKTVCGMVVGLVAAVAVLVPAGPVGAVLDESPAAYKSLDEVLAHPDYAPGKHGDTLRLYHAVLGRSPEPAGAAYWINTLNRGASIDDALFVFVNSEEFRSRYGREMPAAQFLDLVYENVMSRSPDPEGHQYWVGEMRDGLSREQVVWYFADSAEFRNKYPYQKPVTPPAPPAPNPPVDNTPAFHFGTFAVPSGYWINCESQVVVEDDGYEWTIPAGFTIGVFSQTPISVVSTPAMPATLHQHILHTSEWQWTILLDGGPFVSPEVIVTADDGRILTLPAGVATCP